MSRGIEMRAFKNGLETPGRVRGAGSGPALLRGSPGAGHARSEAASTARLSAASRAFIPAVWPCPALLVASLWGLWRPGVPAGHARASDRASSRCRWECVWEGVWGRGNALSGESPASGVPVPWPWSLAIISRFTLGYL